MVPKHGFGKVDGHKLPKVLVTRAENPSRHTNSVPSSQIWLQSNLVDGWNQNIGFRKKCAESPENSRAQNGQNPKFQKSNPFCPKCREGSDCQEATSDNSKRALLGQNLLGSYFLGILGMGPRWALLGPLLLSLLKEEYGVSAAG